jgi:hypothetical protein
MSTKASKKIVPKQKQSFPIWLPLIIVAGVALIVVALASSNAAPAAPAAIEVKGTPALKVDRDKVDFGDVKLGQAVQVSFEVTNVGDQPLSFKEKPYVEVAEGC